MRTAVSTIALVVLCCSSASAAGARSLLQKAAPVCPPPGFNAVANFDLARYTSAPWYIQEQMPVVYQPLNQLYCVRARYAPQPSGRIDVFNQARDGSVTGALVGNVNGTATLVAFPDDTIPRDQFSAAKLRVGPTFLAPAYPLLRRVAFGPYWVAAVDPAYNWAIVVGGPPRTPSNGACAHTTGNVLGDIFNGNGFWLFHRQQVAPAADVAKMRAVATGLGLDVSVLKPVAQAGCVY